MTHESQDQEKWVVCRVCLQEEHNMHEIFSADSPELMNMLHECGGIPITVDDNYPDKICNRCVRCLRNAYKFRETCQQSHLHITHILATDQNQTQGICQEEVYEQVVQIDEADYAEENCVKIETLEDEAEPQVDAVESLASEVEYPYYEQSEVGEEVEDEVQEIECIESDYTEFCEYEVVDENITEEIANLENTVKDEVVDDDDDDVLTSDGDFMPTSAVDQSVRPMIETKRVSMRTKVIATQPETPLNESDSKKKGRKPKDKPHSYICDVCGNIYRTQARLTEHMKFHSGVKPHECEICGRGFVQNQQLVRHMNTHTGNRPYKCNYCPAAFADRSTKTKHHRIHTKERPYECDTCGKTFTYSDNLKFHKMIHTGEKPHACDICGKGFTKAYKMRTHRGTHEKRGILIPISKKPTIKSEVITG